MNVDDFYLEPCFKKVTFPALAWAPDKCGAEVLIKLQVRHVKSQLRGFTSQLQPRPIESLPKQRSNFPPPHLPSSCSPLVGSGRSTLTAPSPHPFSCWTAFVFLAFSLDQDVLTRDVSLTADDAKASPLNPSSYTSPPHSKQRQSNMRKDAEMGG